ncbi:MAG: RIP metalloprotease RseP [Bacilli bacterium]|nr:RIP metalloprotease RseP [Bacilli bacterium]
MTFIYFILILGTTIFIHELGHFIFAKRSGVYVYEFAIGMGPRLFSKKRKDDETVYSIRAIPLGGFVQLAGEEVEDDKNVPDNRKLPNKTWFERFITMIAGALFNFLLAFILLFIISIFYGAPKQEAIINGVVEGYPAYEVGIDKGDKILAINGKKIRTWDMVYLRLEMCDKELPISMKVKKSNGTVKTYEFKLKKEEENGEEGYRVGIEPPIKPERGLMAIIKYPFIKMGALFEQMFIVIGNLFTGNLGVDQLAGPVGIYNIVGEQRAGGFENIIYLIAFLSVNVGFINLIPFPAFDGGRVLFLVIEKIKGSPVNQKVENYIHMVGFGLLIMLFVYITFNDILKLF